MIKNYYELCCNQNATLIFLNTGFKEDLIMNTFNTNTLVKYFYHVFWTSCYDLVLYKNKVTFIILMRLIQSITFSFY